MLRSPILYQKRDRRFDGGWGVGEVALLSFALGRSGLMNRFKTDLERSFCIQLEPIARVRMLQANRLGVKVKSICC